MALFRDLYVDVTYSLMKAIEQTGTFEEIKDLIDSKLQDDGSDINALINNENTLENPLYAAIKADRPDVVSLLLSCEPKIEIPISDYQTGTFMHLAISSNSVESVELLCKYSDLLDQRDSDGYTPLMVGTLVDATSFEIIKALLEAGADVNADPGVDYTPLEYAAINPQGIELVRLLLDNGADVFMKDSYDRTALIRAIENNSEGAVDLLLRSGSQVDEPDAYGFTAAHAAACGEESILRRLINTATDMNARSTFGLTPLHRAATHGKLNNMRILLEECGADVNAQSSDGKTPLELLVMPQPTLDLLPGIELLLNYGAEVDVDAIASIIDRCMYTKYTDVVKVAGVLAAAAPEVIAHGRSQDGLTILGKLATKFSTDDILSQFEGKTKESDVILTLMAYGARDWDAVPVPCHNIGQLFLQFEEEDLTEMLYRLYPRQQTIVKLVLTCMYRWSFPKTARRTILSLILAEE